MILFPLSCVGVDTTEVDGLSVTSTAAGVKAVDVTAVALRGLLLFVTPPALVLRMGDFAAPKSRRATGVGFFAAPVALFRGRDGAVANENGVGAKRLLTGGVDGEEGVGVVLASPKVLNSLSSSARIPAPSRARTSFSYS